MSNNKNAKQEKCPTIEMSHQKNVSKKIFQRCRQCSAYDFASRLNNIPIANLGSLLIDYCYYHLQFLGVWHQIAAYQSENANGTCNRAQYSDGGSVVNVVNSQIVGQELLTISGSASLVGTSGNGHLNVTLEISPGGK